MIKWIILSIIGIIGIGALMLTINLKDYKYPSQIQKELMKEFEKQWE